MPAASNRDLNGGIFSGPTEARAGFYPSIATASCDDLHTRGRQLTADKVDITPFRSHLERGDVLLTQGLRLVRGIRSTALREAVNAGTTVIRPPHVQTVDAWLEDVWRRQVESGALPAGRLLDRIAERALWQQIIESDLKEQGDFTLLQVPRAAEQASRARQQWLLYGGEPDNPAQRAAFGLEADCAAFHGWCGKFNRKLELNGWLTRADMYRVLLQVQPRERPSVVLCHVLYLPPLTRQALEHLATVSEPGGIGNQSPKPLSAAAFASPREELSAAASWAVERHRSGAGSTAIVLLDFHRDRQQLEYFLRQQFDCLGARYAALPVNFSVGMPLAETPLFRDAMLALRITGAGVSARLSRAEVLALLRSPFLMGRDAVDGAELLRLRTALTELLSETVDPKDLVHLSRTFAPNSHLTAVLDPLSTSRETLGKRLPSDWLEIIRGQLAHWGWPGARPLDSLEHQQFERLETTLDHLVQLDEVVGRVTHQECLASWRAILTDLVFQPKTPDTAVQVLGPQEVVGLSFGAIWICGVQSGVLPEPARIQPFLPTRLQRELGMPGINPAQLHRRAQALLASLQGTHASVALSFARQQDGEELLPSVLVEPLELQDEQAQPAHPGHWPSPASLEPLYESVIPLPGEPVQYGGGAAVITDQSNCPFRAWISHRVGPDGVAEPAFGLTPAERGTLVHDALRYVWDQLGDSAGLRRLGDSERDVLIQSAVRDAIDVLEKRARRRHRSIRKRVGSACLDLEVERITGLLQDWLLLESGRDGEFSLLEQEDSHVLTLGSLSLTLRPDRIDRLADGRRLVIDYKTGAVQRKSWLGERPADPQLPLYTLLDDTVAGLAFGRVHQDGAEYVALGEDLNLGGKPQSLEQQIARYEIDGPSSWDELRQLWRARLEALADDYVRGNAAIDPLPNACRYCDLDSVCRIGAVSAADEESLDHPGADST